MKRIHIYAIMFSCGFASVTSASVPQRWTVETSRLKPVVFDVVRGETIDLEATFNSYGTPVSTSNKTAFLCWQTNGMASAWWVTNAVTTANLARVRFTPEMDPGGPVVHGFIGLSDSTNSSTSTASLNLSSLSYRAAFTLRFRPGPGASPNVIALPPKVLDLARTVVVNPPWPTQADFAETTTVMRAELKTYVDGQIQGAGVVNPTITTNIAGQVTSNIVTKAYVEGLGISAGLTTSDVNGIIASSNLCTVPAAQAMTDGITFSQLKNKPNNLSGYGITDAMSANGGEYLNSSLYLLNVGVVGSFMLGGGYETFESMASGKTLPEYLRSGEWNTATDPFAKVSQITQSVTVEVAAAKSYAEAYTDEQITPVSWKADTALGAANGALSYSYGTYQFMNGNTNCWLAGTNYVTNADITNRTHFVWEEGMSAGTVPCSMALWELRNGVKQCVWDQRDWTVWYWNFKASQMRAEITATNAAIMAEIASTNNHAWARHYASSGRVNPDPTTTYIDTPKVCLSPGMNWQTVAEVSGCGYWTIVGNGAVIGGSGTNAVLNIKDFEGNEVMKIVKGGHDLAWLDTSDMTGQMTDLNGWVCFSMLADQQPVGYFSTNLEDGDFVAQTDASCPAQCTWENLGNGEWRVHFLLKPGIVSNACFAKFQVEVQGQTKIFFNAGSVIQGGLIYNGVKIVPVVSAGAAAGTTVSWVVAQ